MLWRLFEETKKKKSFFHSLPRFERKRTHTHSYNFDWQILWIWQTIANRLQSLWNFDRKINMKCTIDETVSFLFFLSFFFHVRRSFNLQSIWLSCRALTCTYFIIKVDWMWSVDTYIIIIIFFFNRAHCTSYYVLYLVHIRFCIWLITQHLKIHLRHTCIVYI